MEDDEDVDGAAVVEAADVFMIMLGGFTRIMLLSVPIINSPHVVYVSTSGSTAASELN